MKKKLYLALAFVVSSLSSQADIHYFMNKKDTLHPDGKDFDDVACYYCDDQAPVGKCRDTEDGAQVYRIENYLVDPLSGRDAEKWVQDVFVAMNDHEKKLKKIYESAKVETREKEVKKAICAMKEPSLSQVFYFTYPKPPEAVPMDEWAKTRQDVLKLTEIRVKWYFAKGTENFKTNLSCLNNNLESSSVLLHSAGHFSTSTLGSPKSAYALRQDGKDYFDVVFDSVFTRKAILRHTRYVSTEKNDMYSRAEVDLPLNVEDFATFEADGSVKRSHNGVEAKYTGLKITRSWLMSMLSNHYAFIEKGKKISESVKGMKSDWMRYALSHSSIRKEELPKDNRVKMTLTLDLADFCKNSEALYDLVSH